MATWTLGEALESALASILIEGGEGGVGAPPDAVKLPKGTGTEAPAKLREEIVHPQRRRGPTAPRATQPATKAASLGNAKGSPVHSPAPPQRRTGRPLPFLIVDNGPHFRRPHPSRSDLRVLNGDRGSGGSRTAL